MKTFDDFLDTIFDHVNINGVCISPSEILKKTRPDYYDHLLDAWIESIHQNECHEPKQPKRKGTNK